MNPGESIVLKWNIFYEMYFVVILIVIPILIGFDILVPLISLIICLGIEIVNILIKLNTSVFVKG